MRTARFGYRKENLTVRSLKIRKWSVHASDNRQGEKAPPPGGAMERTQSVASSKSSAARSTLSPRDSSAPSVASRASDTPSSMRSPRLWAGPFSSQAARNRPDSRSMTARTFMTTLLVVLRDLVLLKHPQVTMAADHREWPAPPEPG